MSFLASHWPPIRNDEASVKFTVLTVDANYLDRLLDFRMQGSRKGLQRKRLEILVGGGASHPILLAGNHIARGIRKLWR